MTVEHRLLFGLTDVVAVTFGCTNCQVRLTMAPDKIKTDQLMQCPSCGVPWLANDEDVNVRSAGAYTLFLIALRRLREPKPGLQVGFDLRFEFAGTPEK